MFDAVALQLLDCESTNVVAVVGAGGAEVLADGRPVETADDNTFEHCPFCAEDCASM